MKSEKQTSKEYITELEDKILDLSIKLKSCVVNHNLANEANERLISKFIHDLKNPIGIAYSFSDMILNTEDNKYSEKLKKHVEIINDSSGYSIKLLNDFAFFRLVQSSEFKLNFKKCNYINLVNEVIENCKEKALNHNISIVKQFSNTDIYIEVDEKYIKIVLKKILENAIIFSMDNTVISVNIVNNNGKIETTIFDNGIGIPKENTKSVFNPFFVENTYSPRKEKCVGLGLSVAKRIINLHKGEISIQSELGQGTATYFVLES